MKTYSIEVCPDCIILIANGDLPEENIKEQDEEYLDSIEK